MFPRFCQIRGVQLVHLATSELSVLGLHWELVLRVWLGLMVGRGGGLVDDSSDSEAARCASCIPLLFRKRENTSTSGLRFLLSVELFGKSLARGTMGLRGPTKGLPSLAATAPQLVSIVVKTIGQHQAFKPEGGNLSHQHESSLGQASLMLIRQIATFQLESLVLCCSMILNNNNNADKLGTRFVVAANEVDPAPQAVVEGLL